MGSDDIRTNKDSNRKQHGFGAFVCRHDRLLTLVGALILFSTFIVKDIVREGLKDLRDTITAARSQYVARAEANTVISALAEVNSMLNQMRSEKLYGRSMKGAAMVLDGLLESSAIQNRASVTILNNLTYLFEKLPDTESLKTRVRRYEEDSASDQRAIQAAKVQASELGKEPNLNTVHIGNLAALDTHLVTSIAEHSAAVTVFADEVFRRGAVYVEELTTRQENYNRISYGLFAVGWLLALVGKMYKVGGSGDGE